MPRLLDKNTRLLDRFAPKLISLSKRATHRNKHAAVVLDANNNPICWGFNRGHVHAEQDALAKWIRAYKPRGRMASSLYVIRYNEQSGFKNSAPCEGCEQLLVRLNIDWMST